MVPNHLIVLMAFLMSGDDFSRSLAIATSAGWDTDCNAGNVGCLNGIRLGLDCFSKGTDLRTDVADRMYVVTSDGGEGISDAVRETRRIIRAANALAGEPKPNQKPRFGFDFPGATQGFQRCPFSTSRQAVVSFYDYDEKDNSGLRINIKGLSPGINGFVSTPVFVDDYAARSSFAMEASPSLYSGQLVCVKIDVQSDVEWRPYVLYYDFEDKIQRVEGNWSELYGEIVNWTVPDLKGCPCYRFGLEFRSSSRFDGIIIVRSIDWVGAPTRYQMEGSLVQSIWNLTPFWTRAWVSSARHFAPDFKHTFCISHPEAGGVVTTGTRDWQNYSVESALDYSLNESGGLVIRANGHGRYVAGLISGDEAHLVLCYDGTTKVLARSQLPSGIGELPSVKLRAKDSDYSFEINGKCLCRAENGELRCGGAGFVINSGTMVAEGFRIIGEDH